MKRKYFAFILPCFLASFFASAKQSLIKPQTQDGIIFTRCQLLTVAGEETFD
ncbi:MAG: hypothetical protein ACXWT3_14660 [Methylococcaceae bacterium]